MNRVDNILAELEQIQNSEYLAPTDDIPSDPIFEANRTVCRLFNIHLRHYFDDICISYREFAHNGWDIIKLLYENEEALFFGQKFLRIEDRNKFDQLLCKYIKVHESITDPEGLLVNYLKRWTNMTMPKWFSINQRSYIKDLLNKRYDYLDPSYVVEVFHSNRKKYPTDIERIKAETENQLDKTLARAKRIIRKFRREFRELADDFVYGPEEPSDLSPDETKIRREERINSMMRGITLSIFDISNQLLDTHVHAIHSVIYDIIDFFVPLADMIAYDPEANGGRELYLV